MQLNTQAANGPLRLLSERPLLVAGHIWAAGPITLQAPQITIRGQLEAPAIHLKSAGLLALDPGAQVRARLGDDGGPIAIEAQTLHLHGWLDADGRRGGPISLAARTLFQGGRVTSAGQQGGVVQIVSSEAYVAMYGSLTSVQSDQGVGGVLAIRATRLFSSGQYQAHGPHGGRIIFQGDDLALVAARVHAQGTSGGGSIQIGARSPATRRVLVTSATTLAADAEREGSGGTITIWANESAEVAGTLTARGGLAGGDGGKIAVSTPSDLHVDGRADAGAPNGRAGTLWLDPKNITISNAGIFPQYDLINPTPSAGDRFGGRIYLLSTGNIVVLDTGDDSVATDAGAAYLYQGTTGALISTLTGSTAGDEVGSSGITVLANGNYVIASHVWNNGAVSIAGAVTWGSGTNGINGVVSSSNSLVGSTTGDFLYGQFGVTALTNGNYVVRAAWWDNGAAADAGAASWGNGATGSSGAISSSNSLVGTAANDRVGYAGVTALTNGNYVVSGGFWSNGTGAASWGNGATGSSGAISSSNSLVGSTSGDTVSDRAAVALSNGNYVVISSSWRNGVIPGAGAVTWGNGATGTSGFISAGNSLVGGADFDFVGQNGVNALPNGNYVVISSQWNNGAIPGAGAVTWGNGATGSTGVVTGTNSLVGSKQDDRIGIGGVITLPNGNYVVRSLLWRNGATADAGAVTWGNGTSGRAGVVSGANSLVGSATNDQVGSAGVVVLTNGNYVVGSPNWDNGATANVGAATWGNGATGVSGAISSANSLVGSTAGDQVSGNSITALANGNYVVSSSIWDSGATADVGAATWGNGATGITGLVGNSNSLVGSTASDRVASTGVIALTNGNYVVRSPNWDSGAIANAGAATWGNGATGTSGAVSSSNSLVGSSVDDQVAGSGIAALTNGNYIVASSNWDSGAIANAGAATWGEGATGTSGAVSSSNSLVGSSADDRVASTGITDLNDGNYLIVSANWSNGATANVGAATWGEGATGITLDGSSTINVQNSLIGQIASAGLGAIVTDPALPIFAVRIANETGGRITVGFSDPNLLTYTRAQDRSLTVTPAFLARTLNTGTAVTLQASNDLVLSDTLTVVNSGGAGGALTFQAGRSILLNASLTTDDGALTLIANDQLASGVVDAQRDAGAADITMANGTSINAGSGTVTLDLRDGSGKTNRTSGNITLTTITANQVSIANGVLGLGTHAATINGTMSFAATSALQVTVDGANAGQFGTLAVNGGLNLGNAALSLTGSGTIPFGSNLVFITNDGGDAVNGTFAGLPQGSGLSDGTRTFAISYAGGDGNDVVLSRGSQIFLPLIRL